MRFVELLNGLDESWSAKEKAKYLYDRICKNITYDERFAYGKNPELLSAIYYSDVSIHDEEDKRKICRTANLLYHQLLKEAGVTSKVIYRKSNVPRPIDIEDAALIFWDEAGDKYYTNIIGDIENCRFGLRTNFFGITKNLYEEAQDAKAIPNEELMQIDQKTGCIRRDYNNILFTLLADEVKNTGNFKKFLQAQGIDTSNMSREEILKNKLQYLNKLIKFRDQTAGPDEIKKFYQKLFCASAIDKFESKKFNTYEYIKENEGELDIFSIIEIDLASAPIYYIYSEMEQSYVQITQEELKEKIDGYRERKGKKRLDERNEAENKEI